MNMQLHFKESSGVYVVHIRGRLEATSTPTLESYLQSLLEEGGIKLLVDMKGLNYLSSAGMRLMLSMTKKLAASSGSCTFCAMNENIMETVKMAGLDRILNIFPTEAIAISSLSKS